MAVASKTRPVPTALDSYAERRELFKDIWHTAMVVNTNAKSKVVKTLRLDEIETCQVGKTKKQQIKNLRHVCNKILDFCNQHDAKEKSLHNKKTRAASEMKRPATKECKTVKKKLTTDTPKQNIERPQSDAYRQQKVLLCTTTDLQAKKTNSALIEVNETPQKPKKLKGKSLKSSIKTSNDVPHAPSDDLPKEGEIKRKTTIKKRRAKKDVK